MSTEIIKNAGSGVHVVDGPLTVAATNEAVPGLIRNAIDQRITKVRPMSTPIDQLSRCAGARPARSMTVEYYSVDPKKTRSAVSIALKSSDGKHRADGVTTFTMYTDDDLIFEPSETIMLPSVKVTRASDGEEEPLVFYVLSRISSGGLELIAVNAPGADSGSPQIPDIAEGTDVIRMGRAATELDVQTAQFQALPTKTSNFCQIFKMQVEESTLSKISAKEVGWNFSDQEEAAIIDMRLGMEKNFLFGSRAKIIDPEKNEEVYLTGGIWNQANRSFNLDIDNFTESDLIDIAKKAFTDNCGSKHKIMICGSALMSLISKIPCTHVRRASECTVKWGIEFSDIVTNFGSLLILHSEIFDQCGHADDGMIIDPNYITKYVHVPFHTEKIDLRRSGTRNSSAVVITEASCLVLRYPDSHLKVLGRRVNDTKTAG